MSVLRVQQSLIFCILFIFTLSIPLFSDTLKMRSLGFTILNPNGVDPYDAKVFSQALRKAIDDAGVYTTLEFSDISIRLAEQNLPNSCNDPQCAIIAGQLLGVDCFGFGTVGKVGKAFTISMQVVEIRTGKIVGDHSEFYRGKQKAFVQKLIPLFAREISGIRTNRKRRKR